MTHPGGDLLGGGRGVPGSGRLEVGLLNGGGGRSEVDAWDLIFWNIALSLDYGK